MRHQWIKNEKFEKEDGFISEEICKRCNLIKTKYVMYVNNKPIFDYFLKRSGISFGFQSTQKRKIECLDWSDNSLD